MTSRQFRQQLAEDISELMEEYEAYLQEEYGGEAANKVVADARFELGEFQDWLLGIKNHGGVL
jgi:signal recognition particle GTPase